MYLVAGVLSYFKRYATLRPLKMIGCSHEDNSLITIVVLRTSRIKTQEVPRIGA